jgi:hypothetical protein
MSESNSNGSNKLFYPTGGLKTLELTWDIRVVLAIFAAA